MRLIHAVVGVLDGEAGKGRNGLIYWSCLRSRRPRPVKRGVVVPCWLRVTQSTRPRSHNCGSQQEGRQCLPTIKHMSSFRRGGLVGIYMSIQPKPIADITTNEKGEASDGLTNTFCPKETQIQEAAFLASNPFYHCPHAPKLPTNGANL